MKFTVREIEDNLKHGDRVKCTKGMTFTMYSNYKKQNICTILLIPGNYYNVIGLDYFAKSVIIKGELDLTGEFGYSYDTSKFFIYFDVDKLIRKFKIKNINKNI